MDKKFKLNINSIFMTTFLLFLICAVVTAALAGTNLLTRSRIAEANEKAANAARLELIPADSYEECTVSAADILSFNTDSENITDVTYYKAKKGNEISGYIVSCAANGYGGEVTVMTGVGKDGKIIGLKVISADDETPGLGQNVLKSDFQNKFKGVSKGTDVATLTGASYSSRAVIKCADYALYIANKASQTDKEVPEAENTDDTAEGETREEQTESEGETNG